MGGFGGAQAPRPQGNGIPGSRWKKIRQQEKTKGMFMKTFLILSTLMASVLLLLAGATWIGGFFN